MNQKLDFVFASLQRELVRLGLSGKVEAWRTHDAFCGDRYAVQCRLVDESHTPLGPPLYVSLRMTKDDVAEWWTTTHNLIKLLDP